MVGSSRCQHLNIIHLWRAVSVIYLLYNSSINIGVTANKNMFNNNVQTLSGSTAEADSAVEIALRIWKQTGRDEKLAVLMNSMHKAGVGFGEVEEAVARTQRLKFGSCNNNTLGVGGRYVPGRKSEQVNIPRDEEEVKAIMKKKLKSATTDWKNSLKQKKQLREDLVAELGGEKTRRFKKTMRMLKVAEEKEKSFYHKQYQQKFRNLKSKYNPERKTENPPGVLDGYSGVKWSDKDLSSGCSNKSCTNISCSRPRVSHNTDMGVEGGCGSHPPPGGGTDQEGHSEGGGGPTKKGPLAVGVEISPDEEALLELPPSMCTYEILSEHIFEVDIEECMAKYRMSILQNGYNESNDADVELTSAEKDLFANLEAETRNPYDEVVRIYDVRKKNIRDIKQNPRITLPRALTGPEEAVIACVKQDMSEIYREYVAKNCDEKGRITKPNLSSKELRGLRSLLKRIQNREVMVIPSDKSGKLTVVSWDLYIQNMQKIIGQDKAVGWSEVGPTQARMNGHCSMWLKMTSMGSDWDQAQRIREALLRYGECVPPLYGLVKDHKPEGSYDPVFGPPY